MTSQPQRADAGAKVQKKLRNKVLGSKKSAKNLQISGIISIFTARKEKIPMLGIRSEVMVVDSEP